MFIPNANESKQKKRKFSQTIFYAWAEVLISVGSEDN